MELQNIFDQLTYGELANLSIGGADSGGISEANTPKVISHINLALSALYTKFVLSEKELVITIEDGVTEYALEPTVKAITEVFDQDGNRLDLNNATSPRSVFMPRWDTLQIPAALEVTTVHLAYQVNPTRIETDVVVADTVVDLPDILLEPLLAYVASRINSSRGSDEGIKEGMVLMNRYEYLCLELNNANILNSSEQNTNQKLEIRGWR